MKLFYFYWKSFFSDFVFFIFLISTLKQLLFFITWKIVFLKYFKINGWSNSEMMLMLSIISFGIGIVEIFFYGLRDIAELVETNQIDFFLLSPKNTILHIGVSRFEINAFGDLFSSIILLFWSGYLMHSLMTSLLIIILLTMSCVFIFALYLFLGSLSFFMQNSKNFIKEIYRNTLFLATQPNSAYTGILKFITLTILPTSYLSFYPVEYILTRKVELLYVTFGGTLIFLITSIITFNQGVKKYSSSSEISYLSL